MPYPVLAANDTWFTQGGTTVTKASITEIEIMDSYTPDSSVTVKSSWDASAAKDGSITCYVIGTKLIIAGNGSGRIYLNEESRDVFGSYSADTTFKNATSFLGCTLLDVSKCVNIWRAFGCMSKLTSLDVSNWNMENAGSVSQMFTGCYSLQSVDVSGWRFPKATAMNFIFCNCESLQSVDVSSWDTSNIKTMYLAFSGCSKLTALDLSGWDVSGATDMREMFSVCEQLTTIGDVSNWNTSACTNMRLMFNCCSKLRNLDVSRWDTSAVTDMTFMFYQCPNLGEVDVSNWDVSKVTNMDHFAAHSNLKRKGVENWKTSSLVNANALFHNCAEEELDLSGWDVSKVQFFCQMFENSPNLKRIKGLEKWNTSAGVGFDAMFERCSKLEEVDLSSFDTTKAKNNVSASDNGHKTATMKDMFLSCNNLKKVTVGKNFSVNGNGSNTTAANKAILPTPSATYIDGADGNWYTFNGDTYAPNAMKDKTAETYYASYGMVADADVIVKNGSLIDAAKAIREKNGATTHYTPAQFGAAIRAIP